MKTTISATLAFAGLVSTVAGHGIITDPKPRQAGQAMATTCGQQMYNNQAADTYGNVQGELQVANGQSDYDAAACSVWLCKGFKLEDNTENVQSFTAGQTVPITIEIRAPHTGTANVSVVKTSSNSVIGSPLISWDSYASNSAPIPADQTKFEVTIPSDLGSECTTAGDCVLQWFWDARSVDQTYEACIDFTVGGSSSGSPSTPVSSTAPSASAPAATSATEVPSETSSQTPVATPTASATATAENNGQTPSATATATAAAAPAPTQGGNSSSLPETFTLDTFISWLQEVGKPSSSKKAHRDRLHARAF